MKNLTIIYVTANREVEEFETKIKNKLLEVTGDIPIISVSQKPIDLGKNICVGEVGASYRNAYIQLLIGAENATTEYVSIAEADQLYPPGYFNFETTGDDIYMYDNLWMVRNWDKTKFYKKEYGDWLAIVKREFFIQRLLLHLENSREWGNNKVGSVFHKRRWIWRSGLPVLTFKTRRQLSTKSGFIKTHEPVTELPHWGDAYKLSEYLNL